MSEQVNSAQVSTVDTQTTTESDSKNVQPVTVYDDQIDDLVYKRDQKSKWTRVRKADKHEVDDVKRTRNEEASERRRRNYEEK